MKLSFNQLAFLLLIVLTTSGCSVIGDIFQAGIWAGVLGIVLVIVVIFVLRKVLSK